MIIQTIDNDQDIDVSMMIHKNSVNKTYFDWDDIKENDKMDDIDQNFILLYIYNNRS